MRRTNVVGTTAAAGSGAQRSQAGERKHRTDTTTGTAVTNGGQSPERRGKGRAMNAKPLATSWCSHPPAASTTA
jgi:hypothetical protein